VNIVEMVTGQDVGLSVKLSANMISNYRLNDE